MLVHCYKPFCKYGQEKSVFFICGCLIKQTNIALSCCGCALCGRLLLLYALASSPSPCTTYNESELSCVPLPLLNGSCRVLRYALLYTWIIHLSTIPRNLYCSCKFDSVYYNVVLQKKVCGAKKYYLKTIVIKIVSFERNK